MEIKEILVHVESVPLGSWKGTCTVAKVFTLLKMSARIIALLLSN